MIRESIMRSHNGFPTIIHFVEKIDRVWDGRWRNKNTDFNINYRILKSEW